MRGDYQRTVVNVSDTQAVLAPALAGQRARLVACTLVNPAASTSYFFRSGASGAALTGSFAPAVGTIFTLPFSPEPWVQSDVGEALVLDTSGGIVRGLAITEYVADDA